MLVLHNLNQAVVALIVELLPARFRNDDDSEDSVICDIFQLTEPPQFSSNTVFWVDCDVCGVWVHNYCIVKKNAVSRQSKCKKCSS